MIKQIEKQLFAMARDMGLLHKNIKVKIVPVDKEVEGLVDIRLYFTKDLYISAVGNIESEVDYAIPFFNLCLMAQKYLSLYAMQAMSEGYKVDSMTPAPFKYAKAGLSEGLLQKAESEELQQKYDEIVSHIKKLDKEQICK